MQTSLSSNTPSSVPLNPSPLNPSHPGSPSSSFSQRQTRSVSASRQAAPYAHQPDPDIPINYVVLQSSATELVRTSRVVIRTSASKVMLLSQLIDRIEHDVRAESGSVTLYVRAETPLTVHQIVKIKSPQDMQDLQATFDPASAILGVATIEGSYDALQSKPTSSVIIFGVTYTPLSSRNQLPQPPKDRYDAIQTSVGTPSTAARTPAYTYLQSKNSTAIYDGRFGPGYTRIPVSIHLFHPIFSFFLKSCEPTPEPAYDADYISSVRKLSHRALYLDGLPEREINEELRILLTEVLGVSVEAVMYGKAIPDGAFKGGIFEFKKEMADCDPHKQSAYSMRHMAFKTRGTVRANTCCPTFLISAAGPFWTISGSVFTDKLIVQHLTPTFWFGSRHNDDSRSILQAAQYFMALKKSVDKLGSQDQSTLQPSPQPSFPYPRTFTMEGTQEIVTFTYIKYLQSNVPHCQTFLAEGCIDGVVRKLVVKFVSRYCVGVHKHLANHEKEYAPKLFFYGLLPEASEVAEPTASEYFPGTSGVNKHMVVMEYIDGTLLKTVIDKQKSAPAAALTQIEAILEELHSNGYVFGDLRPPNVILTGDERVKFIDFNWSGSYDMGKEDNIHKRIENLIEKDRKQEIAPLYPETTSLFTHYPWDINKEFDAKDLSAITPSNDWNMYESLFKGIKRDKEKGNDNDMQQ